MPLQDKTVRCSGGLRPPEENESGSHRDAATEQPLQKSRLLRLDRVFVNSPIYFMTACIEFLVAFANAQGGSVLVGVSDAGHSLGVMIFALSCL